MQTVLCPPTVRSTNPSVDIPPPYFIHLLSNENDSPFPEARASLFLNSTLWRRATKTRKNQLLMFLKNKTSTSFKPEAIYSSNFNSMSCGLLLLRQKDVIGQGKEKVNIKKEIDRNRCWMTVAKYKYWCSDVKHDISAYARWSRIISNIDFNDFERAICLPAA